MQTRANDAKDIQVEGARDILRGPYLWGTSCSWGIAIGRARIIRTVEDARRVGDGDILVCERLLRAWVPWYSVVAGVVSDGGGVLSNPAIVARERKIPVVVGTGVGTRLICDGQWVKVDGTLGLVQLSD